MRWLPAVRVLLLAGLLAAVLAVLAARPALVAARELPVVAAHVLAGALVGAIAPAWLAWELRPRLAPRYGVLAALAGAASSLGPHAAFYTVAALVGIAAVAVPARRPFAAGAAGALAAALLPVARFAADGQAGAFGIHPEPLRAALGAVALACGLAAVAALGGGYAVLLRRALAHRGGARPEAAAPLAQG